MANANILQQVQTYNDSGLALLLNSFAFLSKSNSKFKDFDTMEKNLGDTIDFTLPPRMTTTNSLVVSFQPAVQRVQSLTVDQEVSTSYEFSAQQFIFNAREFMDDFGASAMAEIGTDVEANVASECETAPFRFFDGVSTPITSYGQLAKALALFRNFGAAKTNTCAFLDDLTPPGVVNTGLGEFVLNRNEKIAMSWELGRFSNCDWYKSNLLTSHISGSEGNAATTLTVVSTITNAAGAVTAITFSGTDSAGDANSVKKHDSFQFADGVVGQPNMRYLTFIGHKPSQNPVQFRALTDSGSTGGSEVTVAVFPALQVTPGQDQNLNTAIVPGMQCTVLPSHRCGVIMAGNPLYLAMPRLPDEVPYPTARSTDPTSGCSLRTYYGSVFAQNQRGMIHDAIYGHTMVPEYTMKIALPL